MSETERIESLVQSVLVPGFDGTTMPDWLARRIDRGLGGVCWFGHNVPDQQTARALADELHGRRPDLLVLCDEEGGGVTRLEASEGSSWPGHAALGHLDDVVATREVAAGLGRQVRSAGIDVALAPVVDVNSDPDNPVIGVRSFGSDPEVVGRHAAAFVTGLQSSGVAGCAKHFPGHGATRTDSHVELPHVDDAEAVLRSRDIAPFAAAVDAGVRSVMTAHVLFPAIDDQPATMSARLLSLLRDELGFDGVIVSDALDMHAISRGVGRGPGAVRALAAGVDLLCIGNAGFPAAYDAEEVLEVVARHIVAALDDQTLTRERLEEAAARVSDLAAWVGTQRTGDEGPPPELWRGQEVARRAVAVRGDVRVSQAPFVIDVEGPMNIAAARRRPHVLDVLRSRLGDVEIVAASPGKPESAPGELFRQAGNRDVVVVLSTRLDVATTALVTGLLAQAPDAVVVSVGSADDVPGHRVVNTFGGGRALAQAAVELLAPHRHEGSGAARPAPTDVAPAERRPG